METQKQNKRGKHTSSGTMDLDVSTSLPEAPAKWRRWRGVVAPRVRSGGGAKRNDAGAGEEESACNIPDVRK
jgi:hypothetical protein